MVPERTDKRHMVKILLLIGAFFFSHDDMTILLPYMHKAIKPNKDVPVFVQIDSCLAGTRYNNIYGNEFKIDGCKYIIVPKADSGQILDIFSVEYSREGVYALYMSYKAWGGKTSYYFEFDFDQRTIRPLMVQKGISSNE